MKYKELTLPDWVRLMGYLSNTTEAVKVVDITNNIHATYSHVFSIVKVLQKLGYIRTAKVGRSRMVKLTNKGMLIAETCLRLSQSQLR